MKVFVFCLPIALIGLPVAISVQKMNSHVQELARKDAELVTISSSLTKRVHRIEQLNSTLDFLKSTCVAATILNPTNIAYFRRAGKYIRKAQDVIWASIKFQSRYFATSEAYQLQIGRPKKNSIGLCFLPGKFQWPSNLVVQFVDSNSGAQIWNSKTPSWNLYNPRVLPVP